MKEKIKPCKLYALEHNGIIRHKDAFNKELKVGDKVIVGSYCGHLYYGKIAGCTRLKIAFNYYYYSKIEGEKLSSYISYTDKHKVAKCE